jgi:hypothetical protein
MAETYSPNLAITLIGTGDLAGTWGNVTNTNLGTLLEQAISGYVSQVITDGADTVITIPNGATGVARNMYIVCTGTLTASRNLVVPTNNKLYFINNSTAGGFAVTVKCAGGVGISVPNGTSTVLVCNGTDIVNALNYFPALSTGSFSSTGNITATGTITGAALIPNGSTVPVNGEYLPSANTLGWATSSTARGTINSIGQWTINAAGSGATFTINGSGNPLSPLIIQGNSTAGNSLGPIIRAGTNNLDYSLYVSNAPNTQSYFIINGDGGVVVGSPTGGDQGLGTINATGYYLNGVALPNNPSYFAQKTSQTNYTSNNTLATDAQLTVTLPLGTYEFAVSTVWGGVAGGGQVAITQGTAVWDQTNLYYSYSYFNTDGVGVNLGPYAQPFAFASTQLMFVSAFGNTGNVAHSTSRGTFKITTAGTVLIQMAQGTSHPMTSTCLSAFASYRKVA